MSPMLDSGRIKAESWRFVPGTRGRAVEGGMMGTVCLDPFVLVE